MEIDQQLLRDWRRRFHMYPELSGAEKQTAAEVARLLTGFGLEVREGVGGYGVVGLLRGAAAYKCAALRADMDALPILEPPGLPYRSRQEGVMHACGHDAHMAMVLGAAKWLSEHPPSGSVKFLFQPHEEKKPGGARGMIAAGALADPPVDGIFAAHISNAWPVGEIAIGERAMMAATDDFDLTILGKSGHGAIPHQALDVITVAAQVIAALQTMLARRFDPEEPALISICSIHGGTAHNALPEQVLLQGTFRCFAPEVRERIIAAIRQTTQGVCDCWGARFELKIIEGYPPVINHPQLTALLKQAVAETPGAIYTPVPRPPMGGEDFAIFGRQAPAAFMFVGSGSARCRAAWHDRQFTIEEDALPLGAAVLAAAAAKLAEEQREDHG